MSKKAGRMITLTKEISEKQFSWRNDPRITAWTRQNGLLSPLDQEQWLDKIARDPSIQMFGIIADQTGEEVGTMGLTSISQTHGTAEFSLLIDPEQHKKGYGKAALIALLKYGFDHLRLNVIFGETLHNNQARKMFKEIGFIEEGLLRSRYFKSGVYTDSIAFSILRSEYDVKYNH